MDVEFKSRKNLDEQKKSTFSLEKWPAWAVSLLGGGIGWCLVVLLSLLISHGKTTKPLATNYVTNCITVQQTNQVYIRNNQVKVRYLTVTNYVEK